MVHRPQSRALRLRDITVRPARRALRALHALLEQNAKAALPAFSLVMPRPEAIVPKVPHRQLRAQLASFVPGVHPSRRTVVHTLAGIVLMALLHPLVHLAPLGTSVSEGHQTSRNALQKLESTVRKVLRNQRAFLALLAPLVPEAPRHLLPAAVLLAATVHWAQHRFLVVHAHRARSVSVASQTRLRALRTLESSALLDHQIRQGSTVQLGASVWVDQRTKSLVMPFWASTAQLERL